MTAALSSPGRNPALPPALLLAAAALAGGMIAVAESQALVLCLATLAGGFILRDFRVGVVLLVALLPVSASSVMPHAIGGITGLNPMNLLLALTLVAALAQRRAGDPGLLPPDGGRTLLGAYVLPLLLAGVWGASHVGEIAPNLVREGLIGFDGAGGYLRDLVFKPLLPVAVALLIGAAVTRSALPAGGYLQRAPQLSPQFSPGFFPGFLPALFAAVWILALLGIGFVALSGVSLAELASSRAREFFSPLGIHANDLGRLYAVAYALLLHPFASTREAHLRLVLGLSLGVTVLALMLTFSRGAFLGFAVVNVLFLVSRRRAGTLLLAATLLALLVLLLPGAVHDRIGYGLDGNLNTVSAGRVDEIWLPLLPEILHSPLFGHGLGAILWSDALRNGRILLVTHPHNAYLQALLDMGVLGLGLLLAFFARIWRGFRHLAADPLLAPEWRAFFAGAEAGLISLLVAGFSGGSLAPSVEQGFLWLAIGVMFGLQNASPRGRKC